MSELKTTIADDFVTGFFDAKDSATKQLCTLNEVANAYVAYVYNQVGKVKEKAAQVLQIDRKTLSRRLKEYEENNSTPPTFTERFSEAAQ